MLTLEDKKRVLEQVMKQLENQLQRAEGASREAADYATHEESRAESKWDTQGLEASYLAAGQAAKVRELAETFSQFQALAAEAVRAHGEVSSGTLLLCEIAGTKDGYLFAPAAGGLVIQEEGFEVTVVSLQSPIAACLKGKRAGDSFAMPNGKPAKILSLV